jgi:Transcriptional regulator
MKHSLKDAGNEPAGFSLKTCFCPRKGRPSASMAGEVEERILDAATAVFLENGFAGASLERIAERASASKATLYSRYANKEALFSDVVKRSVGRSMRMIQDTPQSDSLVERLRFATQTLVTRLLSDEVLGIIRVVVADAPRFPLLAKLTHDQGRLRAIEIVTGVIVDHPREPRDARRRATIKRDARILATRILDSIVGPMVMRALLGQDREGVRGEIGSHIDQTLAVFVAAGAIEPFL